VSVINPVAREISAKVVFYGPGLSGKTTTLQRIYAAVKPDRRGEMISLATETDRTIFFDFLPLHAQSVRGLTVRFALYTVPGQVFYGATRKLVLNGADGVVFVADSQETCADRNVESFESLHQNLKELGADVERFPIVFQYNKRDLPTAMPVSVMSGMLNFIDAPEFPTNAVSGDGIVALLRAVTQAVMTSVAAQHPAPPTRPDTDRTLQKPVPAKAAPDGIASSVFAATARMAAAPVVAKARPQPLSAPLDKDKGWTIVPGPATEPPEPARTAPAPAPSMPVPAGISFAPLWPAERAAAVQAVEKLIASGDFAGGVSGAAQLLAQLLDDLPGPHGADRTSKALLLGIDGREYLRVCRLAGGARDQVTARDALLALHLLVAAQIRTAGV
jgi:signal recognition particle receptor subunit beta